MLEAVNDAFIAEEVADDLSVSFFSLGIWTSKSYHRFQLSTMGLSNLLQIHGVAQEFETRVEKMQTLPAWPLVEHAGHL